MTCLSTVTRTCTCTCTNVRMNLQYMYVHRALTCTMSTGLVCLLLVVCLLLSKDIHIPSFPATELGPATKHAHMQMKHLTARIQQWATHFPTRTPTIYATQNSGSCLPDQGQICIQVQNTHTSPSYTRTHTHTNLHTFRRLIEHTQAQGSRLECKY